MNIAINNTLCFNNSEINTFCFSNLESTNYFSNLKLNNLSLYNSLDNIYQFVCDKKQEKAIDYKQKIKAIYNFYLDKFKKNIEISEAENKHLRNYRNIIDYVKNIIPRAKQEDSFNFFYSVYALNELFGCYIDDYLELIDYLEFDEDLVKLGKNFYIENEKFDVL
ncbi:hypothetical protein GU250_02750 [Campylobacter jejuni]|nr:hypothetical protein [Campylobacter jejuni]EDP3575752.1 hypothetical protein [Campylobacter jejuni]